MVKIDLSAMQKTNGENNDNLQKSSDINKKEENIIIQKIDNSGKSKKKISLNSLISSNLNPEDKIDFSSSIKNKEKPEIIDEKIEIIENEEKSFPEKKETNLTLNNIIDLNIDEVKSENKIETDIKNIEEKKDDLSDLNKKLKIADGDTIGTLIVETKKEEIFGNYVSSFEKEIEAIKKRKESKAIKEEKIIKESKIEILKEEDNKNKEVEISHNDVNLDKILENIEIEEIKEIKKDNKLNLNFDIFKIFFKKYFKIIFIIIFFFSFSYGIWILKMNIDSKKNNHSSPIINNGINDFKNDKNIDINSDSNTNNTQQNDIYKTNNYEVKEKLIKYFKNKQNSDNMN